MNTEEKVQMAITCVLWFIVGALFALIATVLTHHYKP
jgi:hypothetical protein